MFPSLSVKVTCDGSVCLGLDGPFSRGEVGADLGLGGAVGFCILMVRSTGCCLNISSASCMGYLLACV